MTTTAAEQAVLVFLKLSDQGFGEYEEREAIFDLEKRIETAMNVHNGGEYDGHEFGNGWATLYLYGSDAQRISDIVLPIVRGSEPRNGSYIVRRFGPPGAPEEHVLL